MINGVNFQPGSLEQEQQRRQASGQSSQGVQEAIKVLSLRLPKVVGAQAIAPSALLKSPGSGGNPQVDSIVERVLSKMFPGQGDPQANAPTPTYGAEPQGPQFSGNVQGGMQPKKEATSDVDMPNFWSSYRPPSVIAEKPPWGNDPVGSPGDFTIPIGGFPGGGQPYDGTPSYPSAIQPFPDLRKQLDWVPQPPPSESPLI